MCSLFFQPWVFSRYHIDTNQLNFPKKDMEVSNYMKDGMIADWDTFEQVNLPLSAQGKRSKNLVEFRTSF